MRELNSHFMPQLHQIRNKAGNVYCGVIKLLVPDICTTETREKLVIVSVVDYSHAAFFVCCPAKFSEEFGAKQIHRSGYQVPQRSLFESLETDFERSNRLAADAFISVNGEGRPSDITVYVFKFIHMADIPENRTLTRNLLVRSEIDTYTVL